MPTSPQKLNKALSRLSKALEACQEADLVFQQKAGSALSKGDYVLLGGTLDRVVALQPGQSGVVALEQRGEIVQLEVGQNYLVLSPK